MDNNKVDRGDHLDRLTEYDRRLLAYIEDIGSQLGTMVKERDFFFLSFLIGMAVLEARRYGKR